jgi:hypothetical protein
MLRSLATAALVACLVMPLHADLTVNQTVTGTAMGQQMKGQSVMQIKGNKMRTDSTMAGQGGATIIDLDTQKMIVLNEKKQEAEIHDLGKMAQGQDTIAVSDMTVSVKPNGQKKTILEQSCDGYDLRVTIPTDMGAGKMTMVMSGVIWVAKDAPGSADYARFHKAAADKGMFFTSPQEAKDPARAKGMAQMYAAISDLNGVPYSTELNISIDATGPMAEMMKKMGGMSTTITTTSVSTEPIGDDRFAVPAGYKSRNR